mmetsp:Transcript_8855/g.15338  ORF Transcript_8855/g.15338 Transcript_8855/m.15338 type:complete len:266 (-) Transcript_8855:1169-1966(-)|eukprot:CAMPEP_0119101418 /NCGR_PEP_ID=MMETSP1180-20130426/471_1 /TAXON_ID=3052 ORGANISM="Chlamydomonas cf sp, Strain CCMP681" /NCGR_SAMPLE_ID=MMETSP1180 /ASSEMBLY_ACC=CAM_ASM_000741 /LENGTH=265 /DNA_ID=CAMNT_0007085537 /DNA_START=47 /DNA_END=844 /DNA_ORIENTATION=+
MLRPLPTCHWAAAKSSLAAATPHVCHAPVRRVCSSASRQDITGSTRSLAGQRETVEQLLATAIKQEDYKLAQDLKKQILELEESDELLQVHRKLAAAIKEEQYDVAAKIQLQLRELEAVHGPADLAALATSSDVVTAGVRVRMRSFYIPAQSMPSVSQSIFGYHVTITNESNAVVMLQTRHWIITDEKGHKEEVRGPGVVGQQPVLLPGKSFEYKSICPLKCSKGYMEGAFSFASLDETDGNFKDGVLEVRVGRFKLSTEGESTA